MQDSTSAAASASVQATAPIEPTIVYQVLDPSWLNVLLVLATMALFTVAIAIALITVIVTAFGRQWVIDHIQQEIQKNLERVQGELRGRIHGYVGFIFGRLRDLNPPLLTQAIIFTRDAYYALPDGTKGKAEAINNLAYYYSVKGDNVDGREAVRLITELRRDYARIETTNHLTTFASVAETFYDFFPDSKSVLKEAEQVMEKLLVDDTVSDAHKKDAQRHLERLRRALQNVDERTT